MITIRNLNNNNNNNTKFFCKNLPTLTLHRHFSSFNIALSCLPILPE